jgi:hypothetical protein
MISLFRNIIRLIVILVLAAIIAFYVWVKFYAQAFLQEELSQISRREVKIGWVDFFPPFSFRFFDVHVEGFFSSSQVEVNIDPRALRKKEIVINRISFLKPRIMTSNLSAELFLNGDNQKEVSEERKGVVSLEEFKILIREVVIRKGFWEKLVRISDQDVLLDFLDIFLVLSPRDVEGYVEQWFSAILKYEFQTRVVTRELDYLDDTLTLRGTASLAQKEFFTEFKITDEDKILLTSGEVKIANKIAQVDGRLESTAIFQREPLPLMLKKVFNVPSFEDVAINPEGLGMNFNYSFQTPLSPIRIDKINFSGDVYSQD